MAKRLIADVWIPKKWDKFFQMYWEKYASDNDYIGAVSVEQINKSPNGCAHLGHYRYAVFVGNDE
jgi:hypothetical protein